MPEYDVAANLSRKKRIIRICLYLAVLSFAGMFVLVRWGMGKATAQKQVIDMCVQNGPTAPSWQQQLAQYGLRGKSDEVIKPYCQCMWEPVLSKMSVGDIKAFFTKTPREQMQALGGQEAMIKRDRQCMLQIKKQF